MRPWKGLPGDALDEFRPHLPALADEMIAAIGTEVTAYARPLEGAFGAAVRIGVEHALSQFIAMVRSPPLGRAEGGDVYVGLGRGEARAGRSLEALLAAYRVGARVAWRRLAELGLEAGLEPKTLVRLAEAIFAYIDELSAESAEGYAREQAARAGEAGRRRELLLGLLIQFPPADRAALTGAAAAAQWPLPTEIAVAVWPEETGRRATAKLPVGAITERQDGFLCAAIPDPAAPGRRDEIRQAFETSAAGVGPVVSLEHAARSYELAREALALALEQNDEFGVFADEHRLALILRSERGLLCELAIERLRPLDEETLRSRERLEATLLAWLRHDGDVSGAARELIVHPQTVRYRLSRLRDLFGDSLEDPDTRFEVELVLRAARGCTVASSGHEGGEL